MAELQRPTREEIQDALATLARAGASPSGQPTAEDLQRQSVYHESDDITTILSCAVQLHAAVDAYFAHAVSEPVKYTTRDADQLPNSFADLQQAADAMRYAVQNLEHTCYARLRKIPLKNGGHLM